MCGRYTLRTPLSVLIEEFELEAGLDLPPRYNVAPSQFVPVVRQRAGSASRELAQLRWGLVPAWAVDPAVGSQLINARSETAAVKPAFREAMRSRRCLIPADGFFEWQRGGKRRQPFFIHRRDEGPLALAGLWERWEGAGEPLESCAILTTEANEVVRPLHDRMPVIIEKEDFDAWLDPDREPKQLAPLLVPYPSERLVAEPVSPRVNSPQYDDPRCLEPALRERTLFD